MPEGGWYPEQRMTREEALKSLTLLPARAVFQEADAGSLEPGKRADRVVLGEDVMSVEPLRIPRTGGGDDHRRGQGRIRPGRVTTSSTVSRF